MMSSTQVYFQINGMVARNLQPSLVWIGQFLNFLQFFQAKTVVLCGRRDVIVGDVTWSLPAEQFQGGEGPPRQN
jgi:hypothetical protein